MGRATDGGRKPHLDARDGLVRRNGRKDDLYLQLARALPLGLRELVQRLAIRVNDREDLGERRVRNNPLHGHACVISRRLEENGKNVAL